MNAFPTSRSFSPLSPARDTPRRRKSFIRGPLLLAACAGAVFSSTPLFADDSPRERVSIDNDWRFIKGDPAPAAGDNLTYMIRPPAARGRGRGRGNAPPASAPASLPTPPTAALPGIYPWILPSSNAFIADPAQWHKRPAGNLGEGVAYIQPGFDDHSWRTVNLPQDWGVESAFLPSGTPGSDAATGRLPCFGTVWYRKNLSIPAADAGKEIFLDVDGAMAYATVWLNGQFVGGWPYGYASWRLDLTPYAKPGGDNELAIRLDNPPTSSRWYPGAGLYRNVWLTTTNPVHVAQWGTYVTTPEASADSATIDLKTTVENDGKEPASVKITTQILPFDSDSVTRARIISLSTEEVSIAPGKSTTIPQSIKLPSPKLWSPKSPNRYVARTIVTRGNDVVDQYDTPFGIRTVKYDPDQGLFVNGEHYKMNGVCLHHDLGALGTAFNYRAMQRQLEILRDMGCNAIRTSHNPPAPELLDLADQMGFLVMDEMFDAWRQAKRVNDYSVLFPDWSEQDARAMIRRDRNHPSVILWSIGNEIPEQAQAQVGPPMARRLTEIVKEEDPTRPTTAACHSADPTGPFPAELGAMGYNYQRPRVPAEKPDVYATFHEHYPKEFVFGSETASTVSSRGVYTFPVAAPPGAILSNNRPAGLDVPNGQVSSYDLYYPNWATSPETEFAMQDRHKYLGGEFVWTGFDYLGEPTPFDRAADRSRSSYFGIIDLAGFPKDRYYLYQSHWRPDFPMAHILPHWNWSERAGLKNEDGTPAVTPVHVYTSGEEAELFLNGKSLGRKKKGEYEYRLRWDDVVYEPGELRVVAYKDGREWATDTVKTTGPASELLLKPDRAAIAADGKDLSFVSLKIADGAGLLVPRTNNLVKFEISGPGEIVATDNGDATDMSAFSSHDRKAFNGLALAIVRAKGPGTITLTATSEGLTQSSTTITAK